MTTIQTIKEAEEKFHNEFFGNDGERAGCDGCYSSQRQIKEIKSHIIKTLLAVFESELESVPEDEEVGDIYPHIEERAKEAMEQIKKVGINQERARQRTHLTEVINYLKQK